MFKHTNPAQESENTALAAAEKTVAKSMQNTEPPVPLAKDVSPAALRDLLEKNLKWSQIIYEQNRRINSKLFWTAFAGWIRVLLIAVPLVLAIWFLPPLIKGVVGTYGSLLNPSTGGSKTSIEDLLKILPISPAQEAQLKGYLNNANNSSDNTNNTPAQ